MRVRKKQGCLFWAGPSRARPLSCFVIRAHTGGRTCTRPQGHCRRRTGFHLPPHRGFPGFHTPPAHPGACVLFWSPDGSQGGRYCARRRSWCASHVLCAPCAAWPPCGHCPCRRGSPRGKSGDFSIPLSAHLFLKGHPNPLWQHQADQFMKKIIIFSIG